MSFVIPIGLPGSGKTEYIKKQKRDWDIIIDADVFYKSGHTLDELVPHVIETVGHKKYTNVFIDGLFITASVQEKLISELNNWNNSKQDIKFILFEGPVEYCVYNDLLRSKNTGRIPSTGMIRNSKVERSHMVDRFQITRVQIIKYDGIQYLIDKFKLSSSDSSTWTTGGTYGTCWDEDGPSDCCIDEPIQLEGYKEFTEVLKIFNVSDKIDKYASFVSVEDLSESDYYGGCQEYSYYRLDLKSLIEEILTDTYSSYDFYEFSLDELKRGCPEILI